MTRNTLPFFGGGNRKPRSMASALPRLSAGALVVSHTSVTTTLPVLRWNTCGVALSMTKMDLPAASCPVTTRRIGFGHQRQPLSLLALLISSNCPSSFAAASAKLASTRRPVGAVLSMIFSCL